MRILMVSPFLPYPPVAGGHAQVLHWIRRLSRDHELAFVGFYEREREAQHCGKLREHCRVVKARLRAATPHAYGSFSQLPRLVTEFYARELAADIAAVASGFQPDVVHFLSTNMAQYRRFVKGVPAAVTALDIAFVAHERRIAAVPGLARLRARCEWMRMLRYETAVFRRSQHVIAVSDREAGIVEAVAPATPVTAVPPGVDPQLLAPRRRHPVPGSVLYVGHMEHYPNLDGLLFLYGEIWPEVVRACPEARLTVAGTGAREELARVAPDVLAAIQGDESVTLAGFLPDLQGTMDATSAMAAPMRLGSGVRNKVIESIAAGLPVVTTRRGAEGLAVTHQRELLMADDAKAFAAELVRLLREGELQQKLSAAGRELAVRQHSNEELAKRLEHALAATAGALA